MMVGNRKIYFLAIFFVNCLGDFQLNFEDVVTMEDNYKVKCKFDINYDDEIVKKAVVVCSPDKIQKILDFTYEFETKTYHKITLIGKMHYKHGRTKILSKQLEKGILKYWYSKISVFVVGWSNR